MRLSSADPRAAPIIDPRYLTTAEVRHAHPHGAAARAPHHHHAPAQPGRALLSTSLIWQDVADYRNGVRLAIEILERPALDGFRGRRGAQRVIIA